MTKTKTRMKQSNLYRGKAARIREAIWIQTMMRRMGFRSQGTAYLVSEYLRKVKEMMIVLTTKKRRRRSRPENHPKINLMPTTNLQKMLLQL
jgi:dihydroorotate dehydrogenase